MRLSDFNWSGDKDEVGEEVCCCAEAEDRAVVKRGESDQVRC